MKKNGFTLIEMIAVITVLAAILLISLPALTSTLKRSEESKYEEYLNDIYMAAENYVVYNFDKFKELTYVNGGVFIKLGELIDNGYVSSNKENPKSESKVDSNDTIRVMRNLDNTYKFDYLKGDYTNNMYVDDSLLLMYDGYNITENTIHDLKNNNDGIMINFEDGWKGNHISFDGNDDYLSNTFTTSETSITMQFVINYKENFTIYNIFNKSGSNPSLWIENNYLKLNDTLGSEDFKNKIICVTVVIDATGSKLYVDNSLVLSDSNASASGTYSLFSNAGSNPFKGEVYAVRVYEKTLTDEELENNYNLDIGRYK